MVDIKRSRAYSNSFFEKSKHGADRESVALFIQNWFPVTQEFCLALLGYTGCFAGEILRSSGSRRDALERAMLVPLAIGAGEFGIGRHDVNGIHYRMFARLGEPLGLTLEDLRRHPRGTIPETGRLVDGIEKALTDLYLGAGCLRVVEGTAYNIVDAMNRLFHPMKRSGGKPLYTEHQLEYITLHLELEKGHDSMANDFVEVLCDTLGHRARVNDGIKQMSELFGAYWEAMALAVFGEGPLETAARC